MSIRTGIVGFGYWGPNLARNFSVAKGGELRYICDRDPARVEEAARLFSGAKATTDFGELLRDDALDLIVVATPVSAHYPLVKLALEAGKDVLVEKPLALTVAEAEELVDLAKACDRLLAVDHTFLYTGAVRKIKELVSDGELGELLYFDSVRVNLGLFQHDINVLWDLAPHDLSILCHLHDEQPQSVIAMGASHTSSGFENQVYMHLEYPSGFVAHFHWNWLAPVKLRLTSICGKRKMVVYDDMERGEKVKVYDKGITENARGVETMKKIFVDYRTGEMRAPKLDHGEALAEEASDILECVKTRRQPTSDGEFGLRIMRLLDGAQKSLEGGGKRVELRGVGPGGGGS
ncbi:MAG: Gfo/Idh/MocA family oxidoreductase [Verrucomicrobiota bacterium]